MDDPVSALASAPAADKTATPEPRTTLPSPEQCEIRFLMVNGESFRLVVQASSTVQQVKQKVIDERPKELTDFLRESTPSVVSGPSKTDEIRILHLGKFLEDVKTLQECNFETGADNLTTVHISVRVPASSSEDVKEKVNKKASACCAVM